MSFSEGIWIDLTGRDEQQRTEIRRGVQQLLESGYDDSDDDTRTWARALDIALERLAADGSHAQLAAIREAAMNGGYISRERVYEVARYAESRSLRGFTRPTRRVYEDLVEEDLLSEDTPALLDTVYNDPQSSYQQASGFTIPAEVSALLSTGTRPAPVGTDIQRSRPWPADDTRGITTARGRNVHKSESCPKYQHTLDVARKFNRKIHPVQHVTTGEARAAGKGICSHCFADDTPA